MCRRTQRHTDRQTHTQQLSPIYTISQKRPPFSYDCSFYKCWPIFIVFGTAVREEAGLFAIAANDNEQYHRRLNLRFKGIVTKKGEDCRKVIVDFVRQTMKMPLSEDDVEVAHTLTVRSTVAETASSSPSRHSSPAADNRIDPQYQQTVPQIIDRFKSKGICDNVTRNRSVLKNMNLAIV